MEKKLECGNTPAAAAMLPAGVDCRSTNLHAPACRFGRRVCAKNGGQFPLPPPATARTLLYSTWSARIETARKITSS